MITVIAEHSVDLSLLPPKAKICDLGCRGFLFTDAMRNMGHSVYPVDIDQLDEGKAYYRLAISNYTGRCGVKHIADPQGTSIQAGDEVDCFTLEDFSKSVHVEFWDVIKCDIEGAEWELIMSLKEPPAKQISVEFHHHCCQPESHIHSMAIHLIDLGYRKEKFEFTNEHGAGANVWDALFILK